MKKIITVLTICTLGLTGYIVYIAHTLQRPPAQSPAWYMQNRSAYRGRPVKC